MITVLTCSYNRIQYLKRLKSSLEKQSVKDFEWVIVDDGSNDGTDEVVEKWDSLPFEFHYYYKENGGKHTAINYGVKFASGDWIFLVDSDDYLLPKAIERSEKWISSLPDEGFAGVAGLKGYSEVEVVGEQPDVNTIYVDCKNTERRRMHLDGDKAEIYKKDILQQYPFPEYVGEKFLSEKAVWNQIAADGYKIRWFNEIIYICNYLEGGLTDNNSRLEMDNWNGTTYCAQVDEYSLHGKERWSMLFVYMEKLFIKKKKWVWIRRWIPNLSIGEALLLNLTFPFAYVYFFCRRNIRFISKKGKERLLLINPCEKNEKKKTNKLHS